MSDICFHLRSVFLTVQRLIKKYKQLLSGSRDFLPLCSSPVRIRLFPAAHVSVRQVHCGTILHVKAAAVICHSLSRLKRSLLCTHRGLLSVRAQPVACKCVHGSRHSGVYAFVHVCPRLCVILRAGRSVSRCSSSESGLPADDALS